MADKTMVKGHVDDVTNDYIERVQERGNMKKDEAVSYILRAHAISAEEGELLESEKMLAYAEQTNE